jgi:microcystin-dependent protein
MSTQNANNVAITGGTITGSYGLTAANATNATNAVNVTGTIASGVTATTQAVSTNNTQVATTAFVRSIIPAGVILMWSGSIASIPSGWLLCNGTSGTPDLRDRFIVGAGSTYAPGNTGGFATYSLSGAQLPSHTHSLSASGTTSTVDINHTHNGTTANVDINHIHSGTTVGMNSNTTHTHTITDSGHNHNFSTNPASSGVLFTQGQNGYAPQAGFTGGEQAVQVNPFTQNNTTGITGTNSTNIDHTHNFDTGGMNVNNIHSHTFTSGTMNSNNTHNHTVTVTGTSGATGSGASIDNRPPYYALAYIMKA